MPFDIKETRISDIKPDQPGGIVYVNNGVVNFKNNFISNITSSSFGACFYVINCDMKIDNCCFLRCASSGGYDNFGNVGNVQTSHVKINDISAFQCSYSTSQCGDSLFYFLSCGASISKFNSSFCYSIAGAASLRTVSNRSSFDVSFLSCVSGIDWSFTECDNIVSFTKSSFINSTLVTNYMIYAVQNSLFDECYFFLMTQKTKRFSHSYIMKKCCSDEEVNSYPLTVYPNINDVQFPILRIPKCKRNLMCSCKRCSYKNVNMFIISLIIILIYE